MGQFGIWGVGPSIKYVVLVGGGGQKSSDLLSKKMTEEEEGGQKSPIEFIEKAPVVFEVG